MADNQKNRKGERKQHRIKRRREGRREGETIITKRERTTLNKEEER